MCPCPLVTCQSVFPDLGQINVFCALHGFLWGWVMIKPVPEMQKEIQVFAFFW